MSALQTVNEELDSAFDLIKKSRKIASDTKLFLTNQALIYANYLSATLAGRITQSPDSQADMLDLIRGFCELVNNELSDVGGVANEQS